VQSWKARQAKSHQLLYPHLVELRFAVGCLGLPPDYGKWTDKSGHLVERAFISSGQAKLRNREHFDCSARSIPRSRDPNCYANASMIIREGGRGSSSERAGIMAFRVRFPGQSQRTKTRSTLCRDPELKKSISMKMRYKMGLNKHAPSLSSATCLHRVAGISPSPPSHRLLLALAFPSSLRSLRRCQCRPSRHARPSAHGEKEIVILKLFYLKFYNLHTNRTCRADLPCSVLRTLLTSVTFPMCASSGCGQKFGRDN